MVDLAEPVPRLRGRRVALINPLADPGLIGVSAGAAFLVVVGIYAFGVTSVGGYVWFAFAGAFGASVAVFLLGAVSRDGPTL